MIWNEQKRKIQKNYDDEKNILNIIQSNQDIINLSPLTISSPNKKLINYEGEWINAVIMDGGKKESTTPYIAEWMAGGVYYPQGIMYADFRIINFVVPLNMPKIFIPYVNSFIIYESSLNGLTPIISENIQEINGKYRLIYFCGFNVSDDYTKINIPIRIKLIIQIYNPFKIKNL